MSTPAADYDGAWKYALEHYFPDFLALFFPAIYAAIDWAEPVVFRDSELHQIAPEDQAGIGRVDRLTEVRRKDGTPALVLIHIEVQSQHETTFDRRMFRYHARIFDHTQLPIVSLAILADESPTWRPNHFGYKLWGCELDFRFPTVKLRDLDSATLEAISNPFALLTLMHRDAQTTRGRPQERLQRKLARFRQLLRQGHSAEDIRRLLRLMEHLLRLSPDLARTAWVALRQIEQEETGMDTFVTSFEEIGEARGLARGRVDERRDLVLRLLTRKFGALPPATHDQTATLTPEALLDLSEALLAFNQLADLTAWLEQVR